MRFLKLSTSAILLFLSLVPTQVFAGVGDFYFEDFTGDYYLSRDEEGISHLKVVENFTTIFPNFNQNKGICRQVPFTNQNGVNVTLPSLNRNNLKLLRNGEAEPIYSIEKYDTYYEVCTGNEDYVTGKQVYTFEYEFIKVATEFKGYQELYWDTNGNGWFQKFNQVTARVHFAEDIANAFDGGKWCYVGAYGEKGSDRCQISKIEDGWQFSATELGRYENLTFDVEFKSGTFVIPEPEKNYTLIWIIGIVVVVSGLLLIPFIKKYIKTGEKRRFYKELFVKPEYQPHDKYSVAEMAAIYIGKKRDAKIGVLLDMIVKKQIKIIKNNEKRKQWKMVVEKWDEISEEGKILLKILNGGDEPESGKEIEIKKHTATATLAALGKKFTSGTISRLKKYNLATKKFTTTSSQVTFASIIIYMLILGFFAMGAVITLLEEVESSAVGVLVGREYFLPVVLGVAGVAFLIGALLNRASVQYDARTEEGLKMSRYMDGLKLYIGMAEAERIKMLQSVEGADTSPEGIVHLYEKLLPYAAIFGLEKSWANEMEKYYKIEEVEEPEWHHNISMSDMLVMSNLMNNYAERAVSYSSGGGISGGGGFSSGFSGGGGR